LEGRGGETKRINKDFTSRPREVQHGGGCWGGEKTNARSGQYSVGKSLKQGLDGLKNARIKVGVGCRKAGKVGGRAGKSGRPSKGRWGRKQLEWVGDIARGPEKGGRSTLRRQAEKSKSKPHQGQLDETGGGATADSM